jgi:hypothetical protein
MEVLAVVVGWFLGIATTPVVGFFQRRWKRRSLSPALKTEVAELREQAAGAAFYIRGAHGTRGRDRLEWFLSMLEQPPQSDFAKRNVLRLQEQLKRTDRELASAAAIGAEPTTTTSAPRLELPFLVAHLTDLPLFSTDVQQKLLRLLRECRFYNGAAEEAQESLRTTFMPEIGSANLEIVTSNLRRQEERMAHRGKVIAEVANDLLARWEGVGGERDSGPRRR